MIPNKILLRNGKKFFWESKDLHTQFGVIKEDDLKNAENKVLSHTGKEFLVLNASFYDKLQKISRGPQAIIEKDIASIIAYTAPNNESKIVEIGTGSGKLTCFLAHLFPKAEIITYEKNKENIIIAEKNLKMFNIKNVSIKHSDIFEHFNETDVDLIIIDIPNADRALKNISLSVKNGGYIVAYLPNINQVDSFIRSSDSLIIDKIIETIEREWLIEDKKMRPKSPGILHTAFLAFVRKL
ncbi:MAG: methyltransferase domain-containing protein [Nanoarchaeota archaeon]